VASGTRTCGRCVLFSPLPSVVGDLSPLTHIVRLLGAPCWLICGFPLWRVVSVNRLTGLRRLDRVESVSGGQWIGRSFSLHRGDQKRPLLHVLPRSSRFFFQPGETGVVCCMLAYYPLVFRPRSLVRSLPVFFPSRACGWRSVVFFAVQAVRAKWCTVWVETFFRFRGLWDQGVPLGPPPPLLNL